MPPWVLLVVRTNRHPIGIAYDVNQGAGHICRNAGRHSG